MRWSMGHVVVVQSARVHIVAHVVVVTHRVTLLVSTGIVSQVTDEDWWHARKSGRWSALFRTGCGHFRLEPAKRLLGESLEYLKL